MVVAKTPCVHDKAFVVEYLKEDALRLGREFETITRADAVVDTGTYVLVASDSEMALHSTGGRLLGRVTFPPRTRLEPTLLSPSSDNVLFVSTRSNNLEPAKTRVQVSTVDIPEIARALSLQSRWQRAVQQLFRNVSFKT